MKNTRSKTSPKIAASGIAVFDLGVETEWALVSKVTVRAINNAVLKFDCRLLKDLNDYTSFIHSFSGTTASVVSTVADINSIPFKLYQNLYRQPTIYLYVKNTTALANGEWQVEVEYEPLFKDPLSPSIGEPASEIVNQWTKE